MEKVYLDYAASTPVAPEALEAMKPYFSEKFGNPGSLHSFGQEAIAAVDRAHETVAKAIGADFGEIIFTGSATESNNIALRGLTQTVRRIAQKNFRDGQRRVSVSQRPRLIVSAVEHESVLETARDLEQEGVEVVIAPVDASGLVDKAKFKTSLTSETVLVSVMYVNNEIGAVEPIAELARIIKETRGKRIYPLFHTDAAQAFQFFDCNVKELGVDLMTISGQKIYGPKGVGALFAKNLEFRSQDLGADRSLYPKSYILNPIITGGGQEFGLRSGTENVPAVVGFAKAIELLLSNSRELENKKIRELRDYFWNGLKEIYPQCELNGPALYSLERAPHLLNVYFPGHKAEDLLTKFDLGGLAVSAGSACSARSSQPSYVVEALGHSKERARSSVRFSFGWPTTKEEIEAALKIIKTSI